MLTWFFNRGASARKAADLYGAVVALARRPHLYTDIGIADTPEGRYEALVLHIFLVLDRLKKDGGVGAGHAQALVEAFVTDMDDNMREMGVGDLTVPKKVKKAAGALYDRVETYGQALASKDEGELAAALQRLIPGAEGRDLDAAGFAREVRELAAQLRGVSFDRIIAGQLISS